MAHLVSDMKLPYLILVVPFLMAGKCAMPNVNVQESCEVLRTLVYQDGKFALDKNEIAGLRRVNKVKVFAVMGYFRDNCLAKK